MLSSPSTSSIQQRRQMHRRQNSTPTIFEAPKMQPLPATIQRQHAHRRGMSLDQRPQLLSPFPGRMSTNEQQQPSQGDSQVSITNIGQDQPQHTMQAAQQQSMAQPGPHFQQFADLPPLQTSFPPQPQPQPQPQSSSHPHPSMQQLKDLEQHIKAVYGAHAQVKVSIVPSPVPSPQHNSPMAPTMDHLDLAPMPSSFSDACEINLEPPPEDQGFNFSLSHHHDSDNGYESSFYSSDAISPGCSPSTSPRARSIASFQHQGHLAPAPHLSLSRRPSLLPMSRSSTDMDGYLSSSPTKAPLSPRAMSIADLSLDASIEETGISPEEVQAYISEQDPTNHRWTCLFPECGKTFGRRENIRSHVQTHLGDRQYKCNHCGKCFVRQHDLKRHAKIHTGDKPYKCPCGAGFARQDALTRHRQRGMCDGAFPGAVKKSARRGRPRKNRPEMADRLEKANKTRQAQADSYASSSSSGPSPGSSGYSPVPNVNEYDSSQFTNLQSLQTSDAQSSSFSFSNSSSSPMEAKDSTDDENINENLDSAEDTFFRLTSQDFGGVATPPQSPSPVPADDNVLRVPKGKKNRSPSQKQRTISGRTVSAAYSTPPSSPVMGKAGMDKSDDLDFDDDFNGLPASSFDSNNSMSAMWNPFSSDPFGNELMISTSGSTQDDFSFLDSMN